MNELRVQKFRNYIKDELDISRNNLQRLCSLLVETNSIIAGGSLVKAYTEEYVSMSEFPACRVSRDFDIYVHLENAERLVFGLIDILNLDFSDKCSYVAPPYDDSFFKKNKILGRFLLKHIRSSIYLDILIVSNDRPLIDVVNSFDLSFCKIWFDGMVVRAQDPEGVQNKTGTLGEDYVKSLLDGNYFTIQRIKKYKRKGFKILINIDTNYVVEKKNKGVISPEDWVVSTIFKYLVFNKELEHLFPTIDLFDMDPFDRFIKIGLNRYILSELTNALILNRISEINIRRIYALAFYDKMYSEEYYDYIREILGIENIDEYVQIYLPELEDRANEDSENQNSTRYSESEEINEDFDFEEATDIDETNFTFDTCRDLILDDNVNIVEHLNETDTFLFINGNPSEIGASILCFDKNTIRQFLENKNDNWFYECNGPFLTDVDPITGERIITNDRVMSSIVNFPYIKIFLNEEGLTGFVPLVQITKLLSSSYKVYYIYPMLENGSQKMITHTVSWQNAFGPAGNRNFVSANHCQAGTNILIYTLKVCRDPERCVRSLINASPETSSLSTDERMRHLISGLGLE